MIKRLILCCLSLNMLFGLLALPAYPKDSNDILLEKLIDKGVITAEEAKEIQSKTKFKLPKGLRGIKMEALGYLDYSTGKAGDNSDFNKFEITRGYLTVKKGITPWLKARITSDITRKSQEEAPRVRLKYYYADLLLPDMGFLTSLDVRVGQGHTPWIDFQEHINIYRMQGTMFQERNRVFTSADIGIGLLGNLGGKLTHEQQEEVGYHTPYSGRFGSYHIGVYNGGGYYASEKNVNKVIEGRFTIRPLPDIFPGLQLSYLGHTGKGNSQDDRDYYVNTGFLSIQNRYIVLTCEYAKDEGNDSGSDENKKEGTSIFGNLKIPWIKSLAVMARYDIWDPDLSAFNDKKRRIIAGISYDLINKNRFLIVFEGLDDRAKVKYGKKVQAILQVAF